MKKTYSFSATVPLAIAESYQLAARVEEYPDFIPSVKSARVISSENEFSKKVEMVFSRGFLSVKHLGLARFEPNRSIKSKQIEGMGKNLSILWEFREQPNGTHVKLELEFESDSRLIRGLADFSIERITSEILDAFVKRASELSAKAKL